MSETLTVEKETGIADLKYKFKAILYSMNKERRDSIRRRIMQRFDMSKDTYARILRMEKSQKKGIPHEVLEGFAEELSCEPGALVNE